ncbi:hypothetical protein HWV62_4575 [Athelia sp. TMB]|nr:hypothetical protein HWV62_4575 [Athelia sp. TMB]
MSVAPPIVLDSPPRQPRPHTSQAAGTHQHTAITIDITPSAGSDHASAASNTGLDTPQRTIRRKQRMTLLKQKSSPSLRQRASVPVLAIGRASAPVSNPHPSQIFTQAATPMLPDVPLGHPSRPYYTAIRPQGLSRPGTPRPQQPPPSHSRSRSQPLVQTTVIGTAHTRSHSHHNAHSQPNSRSRSPHRPDHSPYPRNPSPFHPPGFGFGYGGSVPASMGCSMSGEMEMRMSLARWRSVDGVPLNSNDARISDGGREPGYRFRETAPPHAKSKGLKIGGRVKKLGMGLLELVLGRK